MTVYLSIGVALCSLALNAFLLVKITNIKKTPRYTHDAKAILRDLMNGGAILDIRLLDRDQLMLRSPR